MNGPRFKYLMLILCSVFLGVAALLGYLARSYDVPLSVLLLSGLFAAFAVMLPGFWSWRQRQRLDRAVRGLIGAAEQISRGEFRQALVSTRSDKIGELEHAFENMRLALRNTTFTRNYLHSVLNSMTDAVFVTAPGGSVRIANDAACRLTGYGDDELIGKNLVTLLDQGDKLGPDPLQVARDTGETVLRTRAGQTIPVSFIGSTVATEDPEFEGEIYVARDITERKRAERRIRYLARYDALTKIPNRMQFQHLLQQAIARSRRSGHGVAMLYVDMDRFKEVNDTFGHASGDRVLEVLTERLTRVLNTEAVLGRLAGDEFALFVDSVSQDAEEAGGQVAQLARTVLHAAGEAFHINQQEVFLTVSIGIALCPRDAENVIDLIRNADAAMYYSKQNGGNTYAFYSPEMNAAAVERLMLKSKLRRAVERDEFVVRYQPKVDLRDGRVVGAEALLRWRLAGTRRYSAGAVHPDRGREQSDQRHRRMGARARVHGFPRAAPACHRSGAHLDQSVAQAAQAGELHSQLPLGVRTARGADAQPGTRDHRDHPDGRSAPHRADAQPAARHGAASVDRRFRHRLFLALGAAAVPDRDPENRPIVRARCRRRSGGCGAGPDHHRHGPQPRHGSRGRGGRVGAPAGIPARQPLQFRPGPAVRPGPQHR